MYLNLFIRAEYYYSTFPLLHDSVRVTLLTNLVKPLVGYLKNFLKGLEYFWLILCLQQVLKFYLYQCLFGLIKYTS